MSQPTWPLISHWARRAGSRLIVDLYDPEPLELLAHRANDGGAGARHASLDRLLVGVWAQLTADRVLNSLANGHAFICASEKQRDLWIGAMLAEGLLRQRTYAQDPTLRSVIDVVPFGVPAEAAPTVTGAIRRALPEVGTDDVVLWNGGIWNWLDPVTAVRAVARLAGAGRRVRLVFMGASDDVNGRAATLAARRAATDLGVDGLVLFNDVWVPYNDRGGWLADAAVAISSHHDHLETRYAFRTRLLDCFWSGLPIVCTAGDHLASLVEINGLGATAPAGDEVGLARALEQVLDRGRAYYAPQLATAAAEHRWERVAEPLVRLATAEPPSQRLGHGLPAARHPGRAARTSAFLLARSTLNHVGLHHWPTL